MRSLSCVNVVHLICGIRTMKMNSNRSIYMVKRIKTKNNNDIENECLLLLLLSFNPFFVLRFSMSSGGAYTSTNFTFPMLNSYFCWKWCRSFIVFTIPCVYVWTDVWVYGCLHVEATHIRSNQHNCTRKIYLSRWMRRPFNPERKFMAYRQCHIWKIIHKICLMR